MAGLDVRQCRDCGKLFQFYGSPYCAECLHRMDDFYVKVRDYIYDHPEADLVSVSRETEVDEKYINQFLREGRLQLGRSEGSGLFCAQCGMPVAGGMYCEKCADVISKSLSAAAGRGKPSEPAKNAAGRTKSSRGMHINLDR